MESSVTTTLESINVKLGAQEARDLYAELYRLSSDHLMRPYPADSQIAKLMHHLAKHGVDE